MYFPGGKGGKHRQGKARRDLSSKNDPYRYYQVTASLTDQKTFEREMKPFEQIKDNYPKTILTLDRFSLGNYNGIQVVNAVDWLLDPGLDA